jgi:hypothetical protein
MITNRDLSRVLARIGLLVTALSMPVFTFADCIKDLSGEVYCGAGRCLVDGKGMVWCSRYYDGDAERMLDGRVVCGKGQCAERDDGKVFCSAKVGGAVLLDSSGRVRCYGQCEPATAGMCENTRAASSGN